MSKQPREIPIDLVATLLAYDPITGMITWRVDRGTARVGSEFGSVSKDGYRVGGICKRAVLAHRLGWVLFYNEQPAGFIDHIDGNRLNNAISNLRLATRRQNMQNRRLVRNNTSGMRGVTWHKQCGKWQAAISDGDRLKYLGLYDDITAAGAAYEHAARGMHGAFFREAAI